MVILNSNNSINLNFKRKRSLKYNLSLIANTKSTSHLVSIEKYSKGSFLVKEREPIKGLFFILKGKVKIFNFGPNKVTQTLFLASEGEVVGLSSFKSSYYWSNAIVVEDVETYFLSINSLKSILKSNNKMCLLFLDAISMRLRQYEMRQKHLSLLPAPERIIDSLLLTAFKFGSKTARGLKLSLCNSRRELASFSNTSIELTIRTLRKLHSENIISITGKCITILDVNELVIRLKKYSIEEDILEEHSHCYPNLFY